MADGSYERELVRIFRADPSATWQPLRLAASGGGTDLELPDVLVGNGEYVLAIEAKAWTPPEGSAASYDDKQNVTDLVTFAKAYNADALIGIRWKGTLEWYFEFAHNIELTKTQFKVYHDEVVDDWLTLADLPGDLSFDYID